MPASRYSKDVEERPHIFARHKQLLVRLKVQRRHTCPRRESTDISLNPSTHTIGRDHVHYDPHYFHFVSIFMLGHSKKAVEDSLAFDHMQVVFMNSTKDS